MITTWVSMVTVNNDIHSLLWEAPGCSGKERVTFGHLALSGSRLPAISECGCVCSVMLATQLHGYSDVVVITEGSARIRVTQNSHNNNPDDDNYLGQYDDTKGCFLG